jgi:phenylacetate-CoA ligase
VTPEQQERRLIAQVRRCYERIPFYRERWPVEAASIGSVAEFRALPFITKKDLLGDFDAIRSERVASPGSRVSGVHLTSGTSGLGQEAHPLTAFDQEGLSATWIHRMSYIGVGPGDSIAFTFPIGLQAGGQVAFRTAERVGIIPYFLATYSTDKKVEYLLQYRPQVLVVTPSYLTRITSLLVEQGHSRLPFPMRGIMVSGESHTREWAREMSDWWGCKIFEWYSCMQAGTALAYNCRLGALIGDEPGHLHIDEHRSFVEVLDPDTLDAVGPGEEGEVVLTSLFREAFPVIRFRTRDRVRLHAEPCLCGRQGRSIVSGSTSRYDDMIKIRAQNLWPSAIDEIVLGRGDAEEYQARVFLSDRGEEQVELKLEWRPGREPRDLAGALEAIEREIRDTVNVRMSVSVVPHLTLPRYEFKVRRWMDERGDSAGSVVRYTESAR